MTTERLITFIERHDYCKVEAVRGEYFWITTRFDKYATDGSREYQYTADVTERVPGNLSDVRNWLGY